MTTKATPQATAPDAGLGHPSTAELRGGAFKLPLPKGWVDRTVYCVSGVIDEDVSGTISVAQQLLPSSGLEQFVTEQLQQLAGQFEDFHLIAREKRQFRGAACVIAQFTWKPATGSPVHQSQWYVTGKSNVFIITVTAPQDRAGSLAPGIERIVSGFSVIA